MTLVTQPTALPTRKVAAGGIAGILITAAIALVNIYLPGVGDMLSPVITAAITTAVAFITSYMVRNSDTSGGQP